MRMKGGVVFLFSHCVIQTICNLWGDFCLFVFLSSLSLCNSNYVSLMQDEFEAEKTALIHDQEQVLIQESEKAQAACQKEKETLSAQLQEKAARIIQVCGKYFKLKFQLFFCNCILIECFHLSQGIYTRTVCVILVVASFQGAVYNGLSVWWSLSWSARTITWKLKLDSSLKTALL